MEKKEKSKLKKILENRPILSGIAMIAIAFTFGLVYATNSTYAVLTGCPTGWTQHELYTEMCVKHFTGSDDTDIVSARLVAAEKAKKALAEFGIVNIQYNSTYHGGYTCLDLSSTEAECGAFISMEEMSVFSITFDAANGGTLDDRLSSQSCTRDSNSSCTINTPTVERSGFTLAGWSEELACTTIVSGSITLNSENSGKTMYACWKSNPKTYTVTFNANNGTLSGNSKLTCTTEAGKSACTVSNVPSATRSGYTFNGWGSQSTCTSGEKTSIYASSDRTVYACWTSNSSGGGSSTGGGSTATTKTFKVTFDGNGGTIDGKESDSCTTTGSSCSITSLPIATRSGYAFKGWGTSSSCTSGKSGSDTISLSSNATYYACWDTEENADPAHYYTVKYDLDGGKFADGSTSRTQIIADNVIIYAPVTNPIKEGYVFDGWYNGNTKYTHRGTVSGNMTLKAKWIEDTNLKCEYTCNSGDVYDPSTGKCISAQKFGGETFYSSTLYQTTSCNNNIFESITGSSDKCEGSCGTYKCDTGYEADGYAIANTCKVGSSCSTSGTSTCTETWKAHCFKTYEPEEECVPTTYYTVKFDLDGGKFADGTSTRQEVVANDVRYYGPRTNPVKEGYVFDGWYDGNTKYEFWVVSKDVTLKAKWVKDTSKCEYTCNTGDVYDPSIGKCIKIQKFDGGKNYYTSTYNNIVSCNSLNQWQETDTECTGSCNTESCAQGFSSDAYRSVNTCQLNSACSVEDESKSCQDTWIARCYQTYEAEETCDPNIIDQPQTSDILIGIVWFIGLLGLGYGIYYFKELKNK